MPHKMDDCVDLPCRVGDNLAVAGWVKEAGLVVAVSGGLDSSVLLDLLLRLPGGAARMHVAHLDHQLRPDSASDAAFVRELAARHHLPSTIGTADVPGYGREHGESPEMAARACRRAFLQRVAHRTGMGGIILAHHADDQVETVLLRLLRGTSRSGLSGMAPAADGWLRPLLNIRRRELVQYALQRRLKWREDSTNHDIRVPRNRVRHQLLPHLQRHHNPRVADAISRAAHLLGDEDDYLEQAAMAAYEAAVCERQDGKITLEHHLIAGYHIAIQRRVLRQILQDLASPLTGRFDGVQQLLELVRAGAGPMRALGPDLRVQVTGDRLILRKEQVEAVVTPLACPGQTAILGSAVQIQCRWCAPDEFIRLRPGFDLHQAAIDAGPSLGHLMLRRPRPGDRLRPLGMKGHSKKLSDCFIDAGWPRILREDAIVLSRVTNDEILWVPGLTRSEGHTVSETSQRIMYLRAVEHPMEPCHDET